MDNGCTVILCIPADRDGGKLYVKDLKVQEDRMYAQYRSTYNDIPFTETELFSADGGKSCVITGEDGTVLWRFPSSFLSKLMD